MKDLLISSDATKLDAAWVIREVRASYWGHSQSPVQILRAIDNSLCFMAWLENEPVGFCRVVTDKATFSSITDMIVAAKWQRHGVGTALLKAALAHPWVMPTICILASRDATEFYRPHGFAFAGRDVMKRNPHD
jgi:GNAT superfamily N-acetyltransferase